MWMGPGGQELHEREQHPGHLVHHRLVNGVPLGAQQGLERFLDQPHVRARHRHLRVHRLHHCVVICSRHYLHTHRDKVVK